jgi:hypothetical protein
VKCEELLGALNDYVDGDTRSELCQAAREHMASCQGCRIVIDNIRQTITLCRAGEASSLPPGLHRELLSIMKRRWDATFPLPRHPR